MIRIAIVEDETSYQELLSSYIHRYMEETNQALTVTVFSNGLNFIEDYHGDFDIVLLDIAMPHMNGLEAAKRLREKDECVCLLFVTTLANYAIRGYEVNALDFIVKPVEYDLFSLKLKKAIQYCCRNKENVYSIVTPTEIHKVSFNNILYIESDKHYLVFSLESGNKIRTRGSMKDIADTFQGNGFAFIRNSILVNLACVDSFKGNEVVVGKETLPIARSCKAEFLSSLASFLGHGV